MSRQNRILIAVLACFLFVLVAGGLLVLEWTAPPHLFTLQITGQPGRQVVGHIDVDGVSQPLSGSLPAKLEFTGNRFSFEVTTLDGKPGEQIVVKSFLDGELHCSCTCDGAQGSSAHQGRFVWRNWHAGIGGLGPERIEKLRREAATAKQ